MVLPRIAHTGKEVDAAQVSACRCHFIISFELAAANVLCKGVAFQCLVQHTVILHLYIGNSGGQHRIQAFLLGHPEERTELEHFCIQVALCLSHVGLALQ